MLSSLSSCNAQMSLARRQRTALPLPAQELIARITGLQPGEDNFAPCAATVALGLFDPNGIGGVRNKSMDDGIIDGQLKGVAEKLSLKGQEAKADALNGYLVRLRRLAQSLVSGGLEGATTASGESDREEAAQNVVSSLLAVLLELSQSPSALKRGENGYSVPYALQEPRTKGKSQDQINQELWQAILREDPLTGEHWRSHEDEDGTDGDGSDYESMDVNPHPLPHASQPPSQPDAESQKHVYRARSHAGVVLPSLLDHAVDSSGQRLRAQALLNALEQRQYWEGSAGLSTKKAPQARNSSVVSDIQSVSILNSALRDAQELVHPHLTPIMDEIDIIHEVFLLLQGLPTVIFELDESEKLSTVVKVAVSHLSHGGLDALLKPLVEGARQIVELQAAIDSICSAPVKTYGKIIQTFASAIHSELRDMGEFIASEQKKYGERRIDLPHRRVSLIELQTIMSDKLAIVSVLLQFLKGRRFWNSSSQACDRACSNSMDILSSLYKHASQLGLSGDLRMSELFLRLLQQCVRPFLFNVQCWLSGLPLDSESEFPVQSVANIALFSDRFWREGYHVQTEDSGHGDDRSTNWKETRRILPCFLSESSLSQMIYSGKAIRVVKALLDLEEDASHDLKDFASRVSHRMFDKLMISDTMHPNTSFSAVDMGGSIPNYNRILALQYPLASFMTPPVSPSKQTLLFSFSEAESCCDELQTTRNSSLNMDFQWRMKNELEKAIEEQYLLTNATLKSALFAHSRIVWHLKGMTEFYFMMHGEVMHSFTRSIYGKMRRARRWCDSYTLGSIFSQIVSLRGWKHAQFVRIRIADGTGKAPTRTLFFGLNTPVLDQVEFDYMLPWPLAGVLYSTGDSKRMYGRIACLLFQVKIAKHAMELSSFFKARPARSPELNLFWMMRLRLLSTLNDLWSYFVMTVLDVQVKRFRRAIEGQCDLDDIMKLSHNFINVCYERCFLKPQTAPLHRCLMTMLNLALKFSALSSAFLLEKASGLQDQHSTKRLGGKDTDSSERGVSFHIHNAIHTGLDATRGLKGVKHLGKHEDIGTDSADSFDEEQDDEGDSDDQHFAEKRRKKAMASHPENRMTDEDMEPEYEASQVMSDVAAETSRVKKQKMASGRAGYPRALASKSYQDWSQGDSYETQLRAIELEFRQSREFLVKSLQAVVSSNLVRGSREGAGGEEGQVEGDSSYLDGLILAMAI